MMTQEPQISIEHRPRVDLERHGYACFKGSDLSLPHHLQQALDLLLLEYEALPPDPYCATGNRYRRHSRYVLLPWLDLLEPRPISQYTQGRELNPTDGGVVEQK